MHITRVIRQFYFGIDTQSIKHHISLWLEVVHVQGSDDQGNTQYQSNTQYLKSGRHPESIAIYIDVQLQRFVSVDDSVGLNCTTMMKYVANAPYI